mgnify:FL=1
MITLDLKSDESVLTFTAYGEIRSGTQQQIENVCHSVLARVALGYAPTIRQVCLQYEQYSSWNPYTAPAKFAPDANYRAMMSAPTSDPVVLLRVSQIVQQVMSGNTVSRIGRADSYYASASNRPYWAVPPAVFCVADGKHSFWRVRYLNKP